MTISLLLIVGVWVLNLAVSIFNAVQVGKAWVESKHAGGWRRFMAWCGAIMAAIGFTWCISIVLGIMAGAFHWLTPDYLELYFKTTYVLLVPPLLFTGYAITINSWAEAYRRRTLANVGVAGYNTFAMAYNTYNAVTTFGDAFGDVVSGFTKKLGNDKDSAQALIVLLLLVVAFGGGALITTMIIRKYAAADAPLPVRR